MPLSTVWSPDADGNFSIVTWFGITNELKTARKPLPIPNPINTNTAEVYESTIVRPEKWKQHYSSTHI